MGPMVWELEGPIPILNRSRALMNIGSLIASNIKYLWGRYKEKRSNYPPLVNLREPVRCTAYFQEDGRSATISKYYVTISGAFPSDSTSTDSV